jgi:hypothetical protein
MTVHQFSLVQYRTVVAAIRNSCRVRAVNNLLCELGTQILVTTHVADRLYDHNIHVKTFADLFYDLVERHAFLINIESLLKKDGFKVLHGGLVFVFSRGKIDNKIILNTVYRVRNQKYVDIDTGKINEQIYSILTGKYEPGMITSLETSTVVTIT